MQDAAPPRTINREQLREQIRQTIQDANVPDARIVQDPSGRLTITTEAPPGVTTTQAPPWLPPDDIPPRVQETAYAFFIALTVMIIGYPIAKAIGRRIDKAGETAKVPASVTSQLAQLNQAVESIAIEVERISEGQRFTTKLLSEQRQDPATAPTPKNFS